MIRSLGRVIGWAWLVGLLGAAALPCPGQAAEFVLVEGGKPRAALVLCEQALRYAPPRAQRAVRQRAIVEPFALEQEAAREIQLACQRMSGVTLPIMAAGEARGELRPMYVGTAADAACLANLPAGSDPGSLALVVTEREASVRGLSPQATFYAACELLEQLGVRWFMPGELGTVWPKAGRLALQTQNTVQVPSFPSRWLQGVGDEAWNRRLRAGGPRFPSAHGIHLGEKAEVLFGKHPEYFALRGGQRSKSQLCISNPEVLARAVASTAQYFRENPEAEMIGMGANDGRGFCECDGCKALDGGDYDSFAHTESMTDRYVHFFNRVLAGIRAEFPQRRIGFYAYAAYCRPPVKVKPDPRIVPAVAMITLCRMHGMNNPVCPEKDYERWILEQWGNRVPEVYYRGYWFNLADPGLPFFMLRRIREEVPLGKRLHVAGWRTECLVNWAGNTPAFYLAYKLMWNHTADAEQLIDDFCRKFYGRAAQPMRQYLDLMDRAVNDADYHTGSIWDMALVYPAATRVQARRLLDEARRAVDAESDEARRVAMVETSLAFLEGFTEAMEARIVHDYGRAARGLDAMVAARAVLLGAKPPLLSKKAEEYMDRYLTSTVRQGHARTTGGNRLLAGLADEWQFQIDPERVGESLGWYRSDVTGGNWQRLRTSSRSWSDQGLRYYKGLAWYRQAFDLPASAEPKRVFLWFGAIDEMAKVWLNGIPLGISPKTAFRPFELDATAAVRPGHSNTLVVCVANESLHELGTGGILGPVMLYLPAAGKDARLDNAKPLGTVFPEY